MKKAKNDVVRMTLEQVRQRARTETGKDELARAAAIPDDQIDTGDIPEIPSGRTGIRGAFNRPATRMISLRLSTADLLTATQLASARGLAYQTYIKSLLHEALERERIATEPR